MKIKPLTWFLIISIISIISISFSGLLLITPMKTNADSIGECYTTCPSGTPVSCKGARTRSIDDETNPGCICDSKEVRCNDKNNSNTNQKKNNKKKKENSNNQ